MSSPRYRALHEPIPRGLSSAQLKTILTASLVELYVQDGSSSDTSYVPEDEMQRDSGNYWQIVHNQLRYGPADSPEFCRVAYTSSIPINDKVLTRNGCSILSNGSQRVIKELSHLILNCELRVTDGAFDCVTRLTLQGGPGIPVAELYGDRPFPYYYSSGHPAITGYVFHSANIHGDGRLVTFVKLEGNSYLPEYLRSTVIYLLPMPKSFGSGEPLVEERTKLIPLGWQPSLPIRDGVGRNVYVFPGRLFSTTKKRGEGTKFPDGVPRDEIILEVHDGVIETLELDEELYAPAVLQQVKELGGMRVDYYTPRYHTEDLDYLTRTVYRRMGRYQKLVEKLGGAWPTKVADLPSHLRVSMAELLIAAANDVHIRQCIPESSCFFGTVSECGQGHFEQCPLLIAGSLQGLQPSPSGSQPATERVCPGSDDGKAGVPIGLVMETLYKYSPSTKSYYSINKAINKPVSITSDGYVVHFTECEEPVPVISTPYGVVACGKRPKRRGSGSISSRPQAAKHDTNETLSGT